MYNTCQYNTDSNVVSLFATTLLSIIILDELKDFHELNIK